ncbi:cytidine/uridine-specific hydrolase [Staphylococcus capitis VCU116]|uniref:ribonucleoside hydrolase RihC n=1 Tax=Staphylococcus capitis TaxID=29388 RepID=UPI00021A1FC7|nr:ribonucleoside hydrolase RihC [Staphylococcus capitis]EGS38246.1 cytidine/uridine-specific hydrolase [Staphylococcus capitis VCU116]
MVTPIIIDTDPGIDDAAAISLGLCHPEFDVKMITTVNGNVGIEKTTANALKLKHFFNSDVPVHRGASKPLLNEIVDAAPVHGESGMDGYDFPPIAQKDLASTHAVEAMKETILKSEKPMTIIAIGPLTNIAILLSTYPEVTDYIKEIVLMGGSTGRGNVTPLAEFNIYCDPEAAQVVFNSGLPLAMIGLDLAREAIFTHDYVKSFKNQNETGQMLHDLFQHYRSEDSEYGVKIYDVFTILYLLQPQAFNVKEADVQIELAGHYTKGATVVDFESQYPNCTVVLSPVDKDYEDLFLNALSYCK